MVFPCSSGTYTSLPSTPGYTLDVVGEISGHRNQGNSAGTTALCSSIRREITLLMPFLRFEKVVLGYSDAELVRGIGVQNGLSCGWKGRRVY